MSCGVRPRVGGFKKTMYSFNQYPQNWDIYIRSGRLNMDGCSRMEWVVVEWGAHKYQIRTNSSLSDDARCREMVHCQKYYTGKLKVFFLENIRFVNCVQVVDNVVIEKHGLKLWLLTEINWTSGMWLFTLTSWHV